MNERPLIAALVALVLTTSCAPPAPAGLDDEERQKINTQASIKASIAHDMALMFALATLRSGDAEGFEKSIEEAVDRNAVNLGLFLLVEGEAAVELSEETRTQVLCHLNLVKAYRDHYPFDSEFENIENGVKSIFARLPQMPEEEMKACSQLLPPLGEMQLPSPK